MLANSTAHPKEFKQLVLAAFHDRASRRGVCRAFGVSRNTLAAWLEKKVDRLPSLAQALVPPPKGDSLEMD